MNKIFGYTTDKHYASVYQENIKLFTKEKLSYDRRIPLKRRDFLSNRIKIFMLLMDNSS